MPLPFPHPSADATPNADSALTGLLSHLDAIYGFALTLAGDPDSAAELTERVYANVPGDLWSTLGGHGLRERLLALCVATFTQQRRSRPRATPADVEPLPVTLASLLSELPVEQRAAIALVDQLGLGYADAAAVLGMDPVEFRALLRRGRCVLFDASRAARMKA